MNILRSSSISRRILSLLIIDLGVLLIIGYAIFFRALFPDPGAAFDERTGMVIDLDAHGFLGQAGFRAGDQLRLVQGTPWEKASSVYHNVRPGGNIRWLVRRGEDMFDIEATLPTLSWPNRLQNIIPLLVALFYWGVATLLWLYNPRHRIIQHFFLLGQLVALILAGGSLGTYTVRWGKHLFDFALIAVMPVTIHFFAIFPQKHDSRLIERLVYAAYGIAALFALQLLIDIGGGPGVLSDDALRALRLIYFVVSLSLATVLFFYRWFRAPTLVRQRQRLIIAGMLASLLPFIFFYLFPVLLGEAPLLSPTWLFLSFIFLPLAVAYALRSGEVGAIDWFLNRTLVHVLLFGFMAGVYAGLYWLLNIIFPKTREASLLLATILAMSLAVLFAPLHRFLQYWVDRIFYRGWYDYHSVIEKTGEQLASVEQPDDLAQALLGNVTTTMRLRCACFLLPFSDESGSGRLFLHSPQGCPLHGDESLRFSLDSPLYRALQQVEGIIEAAELRRRVSHFHLSETETALLHCPYARLWIPTSLTDNASSLGVTAAFVVGPNQSGDDFSEEDRDILITLARQTALVIRSLKLLRELQQREKELVQLYRNLTFIREEERKRIARELHDDIIQNIHVIYRSIKDRHILPPEETEASLDESAQRLKQTMSDVRRICNDLRPATLEVLGLTDAIRSQCERFSVRTGILANFYVRGDEDIPLPSETENMLFRILQEALWNVEKHAHARHVDVRLEFPYIEDASTDGLIRLVVQDDGRGMAAAPRFDELLERHAYGLLNMHERAAMIGGELRWWSQEGQGVRIEVTAPITHFDATLAE